MPLLRFCRLGPGGVLRAARGHSGGGPDSAGWHHACSRLPVRAPVRRLMLARLASSSYSRRRLLGGLAGVGLSIVAAGCDRKLPVVSTPLTATPARRADP